MTETFKPKKYMFDLAFDGETGLTASEREKIAPTYSQEQLDIAKQEAFEAGVAACKQEMAEALTLQSNSLLDHIRNHLSHLWESSIAEWQRQLSQTQQISLVIARKLMPTYVARYGLEEIETIVAKVIAEMSREPRLVIRIAESQFDDISARINAIAENQAYAGKVVIIGDADLGISDCRIEWADGGIERDIPTLWQEIEKVMAEVQSIDNQCAIDERPAEQVQASPTIQSESGEQS